MLETLSESTGSKEAAINRTAGLRFLGLLALPPALAIVLLVLLNILIFRTLDYYHWVRPDSVMGTMVHGQGLIYHQIVQGKKNIIVIGDSRVAEGFSASVANAASQRPDLNFIQAGMPGTEARVWYYFLRKVDPGHQKFAGVVLMASHLDDSHQAYDPAGRVDDLTYLQPLTTYEDSFAIARSFDTIEGKIHAFAAMMLPLTIARLDIQDLVAHSKKRIEAANSWHEHFHEWALSYSGNKGSLPQIGNNDLATFDFKSAGLPPLMVDAMNNYVGNLLGRGDAIPAAQLARYRMRWFGAIAEEYQRVGVPVIVFEAPRGPYEAYGGPSAADRGDGALRELAREGKLKLLDTKALEQIEKPEYFFDSLHVNAQGREIMSTVLARLIAQKYPIAH
jgi:hypothetical protein